MGNAKRFTLELAAQPQPEGWYLILDSSPIPGYDVVIEPTGLDFSEFEEHGSPALWSHDRSIPPFGKWESKVEAGKWVGRPVFDEDPNDHFAARVRRLFEAGRLRLSAGLDILEDGTTTVDDRQYRHVTRAVPTEVSFCLYGAHPRAGTKMSRAEMSLALSRAAVDGVITDEDALSLVPNDDKDHEVEALRTDLAAVRETLGRLQADFEASRKPDGPLQIPLGEIPAPEGVTREQVKGLLAEEIKATLGAEIGKVVRAAVRKHLGRID